MIECSETHLLEFGRECTDSLVTHSFCASCDLLGLGFVELVGFDLSLGLEGLDEGSLLPAGEGSEVTEGAKLAVVLESQDFEGLGNDDSLLVVVREGDALENLEAAESGGTLGGFVGEHSS